MTPAAYKRSFPGLPHSPTHSHSLSNQRKQTEQITPQLPAMPIPLFTADEKPSNTETRVPHQRGTVTSTPLTSGSPHEPTSERRRSSASEHHRAPAAASGSGTASSSAGASGREQTKEEREEAERLYEERMEDEYAKREGGA